MSTPPVRLKVDLFGADCRCSRLRRGSLFTSVSRSAPVLQRGGVACWPFNFRARVLAAIRCGLLSDLGAPRSTPSFCLKVGRRFSRFRCSSRSTLVMPRSAPSLQGFGADCWPFSLLVRISLSDSGVSPSCQCWFGWVGADLCSDSV